MKLFSASAIGKRINATTTSGASFTVTSAVFDNGTTALPMHGEVALATTIAPVIVVPPPLVTNFPVTRRGARRRNFKMR